MIRFADHATAPHRGLARVFAPAGSSTTTTSAYGTWDILPAPVRGLSGRLSRGFAGTGGIFSFIH
ncbi:hypothetical protein [Desulfovibrio ferrophilus]|uniref:Uncharacterized protein n=1 Tax=Desulfovibrio ferrophilus TaxID=241368 RepID=A0A2Z6B3Q2_9BACT|nr:hypothetical protein [Desulfovibrio ferrophilus]BBD10040.1 uncharacterized protein DFE_3314 [Desulfovibrio ferrophilus]